MIHAEAERLLAAGAVLDDLAPDERTSYEAHRAGCGACRRLELELDHVLADLALVVPERVPPADLLGGIRRALAAEAGPGPGTAAAPRVASPAASRVPRADVVPFRRPARKPMLATLGLAAALGIVAIGLGARSASLERDLQAANLRVASLESALAERSDAVTVALNPSHVTVALHGDALAPAADAAVVFVPGTPTSFVMARNLPATPAGRAYQLWYADGAGVHPLQVVTFDGAGTFVEPIGVDLGHGGAVMITLEDAGGSTGEPGPQVVFGEL